MALKFRRTLSMEDLVNASDEEMDDLLSNSLRETNSSRSQQNIVGNGQQQPAGPYSQQVSSGAIKNGMRVGPILAPGIDSPENDDFFLHGPQAPILNLNNTDLTQDVEQSAVSANGIPRSKSVRFHDPQDEEVHNNKDPLKKARSQVHEVTDKMRDNVSRLLDREANLDSLADLSDQVSELSYLIRIYCLSSSYEKDFYSLNSSTSCSCNIRVTFIVSLPST
jgi:hypothetical protein